MPVINPFGSENNISPIEKAEQTIDQSLANSLVEDSKLAGDHISRSNSGVGNNLISDRKNVVQTISETNSLLSDAAIDIEQSVHSMNPVQHITAPVHIGEQINVAKISQEKISAESAYFDSYKASKSLTTGDHSIPVTMADNVNDFKHLNGREITIPDHFVQGNYHKLQFPNRDDITSMSDYVIEEKFLRRQMDNKDKGDIPVIDHFIADNNVPDGQNVVTEPYTFVTNDDGNTVKAAKFSGSATVLNPFGDGDMDKIIKQGYSKYEQDRLSVNPPISPLAPFIRMEDPLDARTSVLTTYNRFKLPVSDLEFRKGFMHLFFTRPECYVMSVGNKISQQAFYDEDFSSAYSRYPHLLSLLSPVYVTGSFDINNLITTNWNYLLSNRVVSISATPQDQLSISENGPKSVEGYTVSIGKHLESRRGATIEITFRETKHLEVFEFLRLWMLYIEKIHTGRFLQSYNGYQQENGFENPGDFSGGIAGFHGGSIFHPYDRAIDYMISLFQVFTDEAMDKIIYWSKWYGLYPTQVSLNGLNLQNGGPTANELTVSCTFKYQAKRTNLNKTLVEFNYNGGMTDATGHVLTNPVVSYSNSYAYTNGHVSGSDIPYAGAAGMFTGSPVIVMKENYANPISKSEPLYEPHLLFASIRGEYDNKLNLNIRDAGETIREPGTVVVGTV